MGGGRDMNDQPGKYFDNPAFCEYIFLLVEIERLIREDRNESPEGEAIYEEMDAPGDKLDRDEMNAVSAFAADLTRLSEKYASILLPTVARARPAVNAIATPPAPHPTDSADSPKELIP
jgi:hypothetical protein